MWSHFLQTAKLFLPHSALFQLSTTKHVKTNNIKGNVSFLCINISCALTLTTLFWLKLVLECANSLSILNFRPKKYLMYWRYIRRYSSFRTSTVRKQVTYRLLLWPPFCLHMKFHGKVSHISAHTHFLQP